MDKTKFKYQGGVQTAIDQRQEMRSVAKQMTILMELNQQLGEMVVAQQPVIEKVAETGDTVNNDFDHGNKDVGGAISSAKARNRKKMWCFLLARKLAAFLLVSLSVPADDSDSSHHYHHRCHRRRRLLCHQGMYLLLHLLLILLLSVLDPVPFHCRTTS